MAACQYCGNNAGFLRKQHSESHDLYTEGIQEMAQLTAQAPAPPASLKLLCAAPSGPLRPGPAPPRKRTPCTDTWTTSGRPLRTST